MSSHLFRRGGLWWARLVVPARLRDAAGRREFIQSCRTHEVAIAKLVAAVLLADWRRQLLRLESVPMTIDVLKLIEGSPVLSGAGWVPLSDAVGLSGIGKDQLLRAAADGHLTLFCRVSRVRGHQVAIEHLDPIDPMAGRAGGVDIPPPELMPNTALESTQTGVLPLNEPEIVAAIILAECLVTVELVGLDWPGQPGMLFVPETVLTVPVDKLEVLVADVERLRQRMALGVSTEAIERARQQDLGGLRGSARSEGEKADKLYSEALDAYAATPSGIPGSVASMAEQKQKHRGCSLFIELVGNLPLSAITADLIREFREKLKSLPAKPNNIPGAYRRTTMAATLAALREGGIEWPMMSETAQHERLLWVRQMFGWLVAQKWLVENPALVVLGENTKTASDRKAIRRAEAARAETDDDDTRRAFTAIELKQIFSNTHFKAGSGAHVEGNARWYPFEYWLPLIGLFAGCRIGEICQLRLDDLRQSAEGRWFFDLNETTADKSLKNVSAARQVPVSPVLIELGLLTYRDELKKMRYQRLFPELTYAESDARYAKEPIRKMSAMLEGLGMTRDSTRVFHCFRANFNNAMLRVPFTSLPFDDPDLKRYIRLKIIGHKVVGVNEKHYSSTTMDEKAALVLGVQYDLPVIAKFDIEFGVKQVRVAIDNKKGPRRGREDMGPLNDK